MLDDENSLKECSLMKFPIFLLVYLELQGIEQSIGLIILFHQPRFPEIAGSIKKLHFVVQKLV